MTRLMKGSLALAAVVALTGAIALAEEAAWLDTDDKLHHFRHGNALFFGEGDAEEFDLGELRDGESRTFGQGEKTVTVERRGDVVTINHDDEGPHKARRLTCTVGVDSCKVLTFDDDPERVMILVEKRRSCVDGEGDCEDVAVFGRSDGEAHMIIEHLNCAGDDDGGDVDCNGLAEIVIEAGDGNFAFGAHAGLAEGNVFLRQIADAAGDVGHFMLHEDDQTVLSCPEGDASIRVDQAEADDTFLCPKHSVPMERQSLERRIQFIRKGHVHDDD